MLTSKLREAALDIRRKPWPISQVIPLLQQAADEIDKLESELDSAYRQMAYQGPDEIS